MVSRIPPEWLLFALKKELSWLFVGGLITPVFSYISSYGFLCHHAQSYLRFAFVFVVDLESCLLSCSVGRALCLDCRVSGVPPGAAHFSLKNVLSWVSLN